MTDFQNPWHRVQKVRKKIGGIFSRQKRKLKEKNKTYRKKAKDLFKKGKD